jgi:hypothetical protein
MSACSFSSVFFRDFVGGMVHRNVGILPRPLRGVEPNRPRLECLLYYFEGFPKTN